jgi:AcrR family transcriptional regulator
MVINAQRSQMSSGQSSRAALHVLAKADGGVAPRPGTGRRERRAAETRLRLFRCALQLFSERGFSNVTVEDITEAADVGKGTFFNYFESKDYVLSVITEIQLGKAAEALALNRWHQADDSFCLASAFPAPGGGTGKKSGTCPHYDFFLSGEQGRAPDYRSEHAKGP